MFQLAIKAVTRLKHVATLSLVSKLAQVKFHYRYSEFCKTG